MLKHANSELEIDLEAMLDDLERYRLDHKISQEVLAAKLGVSHSTLHRWYHSDVVPNLINRHSIIKLLHV